MNKQKVIRKFLDRPYTVDMGAKRLAKWWKVDEELVREARKEVKALLREAKPKENKMPKILIFDIETAPTRAYVYQTSMWRSNINEGQIISQWFMLSWSGRFLGSTETFSNVLTPEEAVVENDKRISENLWKVLNEADIVISHNGLHFDVPNVNTRFLFNGILPPSPYQHIDTLRIAKRQFGFTHNGLNAIAKFLGLSPKMETGGFKLWTECMDGNPEALLHMEKYNRHDVELLELVYLKLRPWIKGHPNIGLFLEEEEPVCPNCGSKHMHSTEKYYYTSVSKFDTLRCENCGGIARTRISEYPKELRKHLVVSMYR